MYVTTEIFIKMESLKQILLLYNEKRIKMSKQRHKKFLVQSKQDYIIYLRHIIIQSYKLMQFHSSYINELKHDIDRLKLHENPKVSVESTLYEKHNDKIQRISSKLLNLFGDLQKESISYYKFRKTLVKRNIEVNDLLGKIPEDIRSLLSSANEARNWGLHEPESLLTAHFDNIKKLWPKEHVEYYLTNFTEINIPNFKNVEAKWLISLYQECLSSQNCNNAIYEQMIKDYETLIGNKVTINERTVNIRPFESEIMLPKTSLQIQQGKYKNSN